MSGNTNESSGLRLTAAQSDTVTLAVLVYTALYFTYLWFFVSTETEALHWVTLVLLPSILLWVMLRSFRPAASLAAVLEAVGFRRDGWGRGLLWGIVCGLLLGALQTVVSNQRALIWETIHSGAILYRLPLALALMLVTAGFTEEFFFRGVLQSALSRCMRHRWLSVLLASVVFGLYHLPYAYLNPSWPSHGHFAQALSEGVLMSTIIGIVLGMLYARTRHLIAPIVCHSLFNAVWAMAMIDKLISLD